MDKVDIGRLKKFASEKLRNYHPLYEMIMEEPQKIPNEEFVVKVGVWLRLLRSN